METIRTCMPQMSSKLNAMCRGEDRQIQRGHEGAWGQDRCRLADRGKVMIKTSICGRRSILEWLV